MNATEINAALASPEILRNAAKLASKYAKIGSSFEDLRQVALMAAYEKLGSYDSKRGASVATFAFQWMRLAVQREATRERNMVSSTSVMGRGRDVSLDSPFGDDEESTLGSLLPDDSDVEAEVMGRELRSALNEVLAKVSNTEVEADIISLRLTGSATLADIGEKWNLSRERVRQIEARLLPRVRKALVRAKLDC